MSRVDLTGLRDAPIAGKTSSLLIMLPRRTLTSSDSGAGSGSRVENFEGEFSELVQGFWNWRIRLTLKTLFPVVKWALIVRGTIRS